eukprot:79593-Amorphochlora_amoeboformis.AAC.3
MHRAVEFCRHPFGHRDGRNAAWLRTHHTAVTCRPAGLVQILGDLTSRKMVSYLCGLARACLTYDDHCAVFLQGIPGCGCGWVYMLVTMSSSVRDMCVKICVRDP